MRRRRKGRPTPIARVIPRVLDDLGLGMAAAVAQLAERWEEVVGVEIAAHCRPIAMRGRQLELVVEAPVWTQQLQLRRPEILAALKRELGDAAPAELRLSVR